MTAHLGDVATVTMGQSPPSLTVNEAGEGIPFIQGNAEFGTRYPVPRKFCTQPKKCASDGDILLSVRAPVGALNIASGQLCIGRGIAAITATSIDAQFLWYVLAQQIPRLARVSQGSTFPAVSKAAVQRLTIPVPPARKQRQIAKILSVFDEVIEITKEIARQIALVKSGLIDRLLYRKCSPNEKDDNIQEETLFMYPDHNWIQCRLLECVSVRTQKTTPEQDDQRRYIGLEHLAQRRPKILGWSPAGGTISMKTVFCKGDVLFGKLRPNLRKSAVASFNGLCSTDILPLVAKHGLDSSYLLQLLQSSRFAQHAIITASGTKMPRTSWKQIGEFRFARPPLCEQREIATVLSSMDDAIEQNEGVVQQLQLTKRSLIAVLLTGELGVRCDIDVP